ncbi:MAG TPA: capsule assembly Wzi family protein [Candidatus Sulfotelmatobacter sp.]
MPRWFSSLAQGCLLIFLIALSRSGYGQQSEPPDSPGTVAQANSKTSAAGDSATGSDDSSGNQYSSSLKIIPRRFLEDQLGLWSSPRKIRLSDATWLVPLGGLTAAFIATDSDVGRSLNNDADTLKRYRDISNYGAGAFAGVAGGAYLLGLATHDDHQRETGFLSGEAAIDSVVIAEALKYATGRERPYTDNAKGKFWQSGGSFPSVHAAVAWSVAGVVAHEYPNPFVRFLSYGLATVVSASRVEAQQHFPSDVLVGSALGWLVGEYVYRQHHDPGIAGRDWSLPALHPDRPMHWQAKNMGSPYVQLDSWVYPAFDRLIALGFIRTGFLDMRPWTRMECARLVLESQDQLNEDDPDQSEAARLHSSLQSEFSSETELLSGGNNLSVNIESAYSRATEVSGKPLTDGYHFAQTVIDDYGRPNEEGFNNVTGLSGWAEDGPFAGYARVEYQHAPGAPALPLTARQAISVEDFRDDVSFIPQPFPLPPNTPTSSVDQAHLLDTYVAMNLSDWQLSYGKQSLWWGPDKGGAMMFSDNADPLRMFRINRVTPFTLPSFLGVFGPMRVEFFLGQYSGYEFVLAPTGLIGQYGQSLNPQPIIHGERISFKPTSNLEIGLSRTTDYGGPGYPLTTHTFFRSLFSTGNTNPGLPNKPGSRRSGLDFSYRIPGLRDQMTFYAEGLAEHDEVTPLLGPDVASWLAGIYIPRLPRIPKMDLRVEGGYTDPPYSAGDVAFGAFYFDATWISGFQNAGHLMGSWMGRQGQGAQAWSTYWFTPQNKLEFSYRHQKVSQQFLSGGGTVADASVKADFRLKSIFGISASVQYEAWTFPVLAFGRQNNVTTMIQLSLWPKSKRRPGAASE